MSANWTIQNTSVVGETQWMNANYIDINVANNAAGSTDFIEISGYTAGSISFTLDSSPSTWAGGSSLEASIQGAIGGTFAAPDSVFFAQTQTLTQASGSTLTTFVVEWNIPLQFVKLFINNDGTGNIRNITNIRLICESQGGGIGYTSSSGATIGPGGVTPQVQFNDGGVFGGASGVLYDKTANTNTGQVKLEAGSAPEPMLAFSDNGLPTGNYDTGMYSAERNAIGFATGGTEQATIFGTGSVLPASHIIGLNVGTTAQVTGIRRLSSTAVNSWEDGNCGNSSQLVFVPSDFMIANPTHGDPRAPQGAITTAFINLVGNAQDWLQTSGNRYGEPTICTATPDDCLVATKLIPKGFVIKEDGFRMTIFGINNKPDFQISLAYRRVRDLTVPVIPGNVFVDTAYTLNTTVPIVGMTGPSGTAAIGDGVGFLILYIQPPAQLLSTDGGIRGAIIDMARI